ncbi:MAG: acetolactate synthase large subunit [Gammaproteobacteria bacterium]|nr:acetolactate synthase large subunit [Gammaproteobacteria bacterium]MBI5617833.1 acetolactate synthase large subunit [Gammaproteobacteria bacterium]
MNGAQALFETLVAAGLDTCFANPGTSEMHLVTAIGQSARMRPILCLFEGVASGAADGYARMLDRPALTLTHLGPGFANAMANLHNARKAHVPMVNIVGDHAPYHLQYDAPLTSDVAGHVRLHSAWHRAARSAQDLSRAGAEAVQAATTGAGRIATVIAPANFAWEPADGAAPPLPAPAQGRTSDATIAALATLLGNGRRTGLVLGGRAQRAEALVMAGRIAQATGARLLGETFPPRLARGAGRVKLERIPYFAELAIEFLEDLDQVVLVAVNEPVAFFAYPNVPSRLLPERCAIHELVGLDEDVPDALARLAAAVGATTDAPLQRHELPPIPEGPLTPAAIGACVAKHLPANAIVCDEAITCSLDLYRATEGAAPHDFLAITGGSIGIGLPLAFGAAIACPDRQVVALQADGSAMYTVQALWSMAREQTDVTVVLLNNASYAILNVELARLQAGAPTPKTLTMLDLGNPVPDWVSLAKGMGVSADRVEDTVGLERALAQAAATRGPKLIEVMVARR